MMDSVLKEVLEDGSKILVPNTDLELDPALGIVNISRLSKEKSYEVVVLG